MLSSSEQFERLLAASLSGDDAARNRLMARLEPIIRGFFLKRIGRRDEVSDMIQNTLLRVLQSLDDVREPAALRAFTMKAALFELHDFYRGRYRGKEAVPADFPEIAAAVRDASATIDVETALRKLSPKARRIVELRQYGFRYAEIAEMVGSTEAAIKMQVKRAFERMRDILASVVVLVALLLMSNW